MESAHSFSSVVIINHISVQAAAEISGTTHITETVPGFNNEGQTIETDRLGAMWVGGGKTRQCPIKNKTTFAVVFW